MRVRGDLRDGLRAAARAGLLIGLALSLFIARSTPAEFAAYLDTEVVQWTKLVREAGIKAE